VSGFHEAFIQPVGPGAILRDARETREMTVGQLAQALHVSVSVLEAMEDNRFDVFDAPVYARGFIRQYAALVDIDPQPVLDAYARLGAGPSEPSHVPPPPPLTPVKPALRLDWRKPVAGIGLVLLLVASYLYVSHQRDATRDATPVASAASAAEAPLVGEPPPVRPPAPVGDPDKPVARNVAAVASAPSADAEPSVSSRAVPPPSVAGDAILLRGVHETWVEIRDATGAQVFNDLVRAGELRTVRGAGPWRVYLRDGNAVEVRVGAHIVDAPAASGADGPARYGLRADGTVVP
jgi:cytoskeleton protein RodZ